MPSCLQACTNLVAFDEVDGHDEVGRGSKSAPELYDITTTRIVQSFTRRWKSGLPFLFSSSVGNLHASLLAAAAAFLQLDSTVLDSLFLASMRAYVHTVVPCADVLGSGVLAVVLPAAKWHVNGMALKQVFELLGPQPAVSQRKVR